MKGATPHLLPLLRSRAQGDILAWILLHPESSYSLIDVARAVGVSGPTVMREVDRLVDAGLVSEERQGNQRRVRAATDNVVYPPLAELLAVTFGPQPVLRESLSTVPGIREAYIYGSWAARYSGVAGEVPRDIDVLVIGEADPDLLEAVAEHAAMKLGRDVDIRRVRPTSWDAAESDSFKKTVTSRPLVTLVRRVEQGR